MSYLNSKHARYLTIFFDFLIQVVDVDRVIESNLRSGHLSLELLLKIEKNTLLKKKIGAN